MASTLVRMAKGIKEGNWKVVVQAYNNLTGQKLEAPKGRKKVLLVADVPLNIRRAIGADALSGIQPLIQELLLVATGKKSGNLVNLVKSIVREVGKAELLDVADDSEDDNVEQEEGADEPAADTVEKRASHARAVSRGEASPDFAHVHVGVASQDEHPEFGKAARTEPFPVGTFKNTFDPKNFAKKFVKEMEFDKKVTAGVEPTERRPPPRKVNVVCGKCGKKEKVDVILAPRNIGTETEPDKSTYICDNCIKRDK